MGAITKGRLASLPGWVCLDRTVGSFFFPLKHTRAHTHAHTHTHRVSPHLSPAFPLRLFFRCWPCSRQKVRGGPLPGQPSGEEAGGRALQPGQKSGPSQGLSGQAPAPPAGPRAQCGDRGQLSCASAPPPRPSRLPQHPRPGQRQAKAGEGAVGQTWGPGSIQARAWRGHRAVVRMAGKVRPSCCCPRGASGGREGDPDALQGSILRGLRSQPPA